MRKTKFKQLAAGILVVLSLFVSLISACACHDNSVQAKTSEHCQPQKQQPSHEVKPDSHSEASAEERQADLEKNVSVNNDGCCCISPAPKGFAKTETVKSEKQSARILPAAQIEIDLIPQIASVKTVDFAQPFYLSDSFYNISPGRAPPCL